jgi:hypothetical protein
MPSSFVVDDRAQRALLAHYGPAKLARIFQAAARAGAKAAEPTMRAAAPVGTSKRPSQFYRREGLSHGALAATVAARRIRKRGLNKATIGFVVGPAGRNAFTRQWVTGGTRPHMMRGARGGRFTHPGQRANPWVDRAEGATVGVASRASAAVIQRYVSKIPGA